MEIGPSSNHYHYGSEHFLTITIIDAIGHYFTPNGQLLKCNLHPPFHSLLQLCQPNMTRLFSSSFSRRIITSFFSVPFSDALAFTFMSQAFFPPLNLPRPDRVTPPVPCHETSWPTSWHTADNGTDNSPESRHHANRHDRHQSLLP
jgi:hypothetical protein